LRACLDISRQEQQRPLTASRDRQGTVAQLRLDNVIRHDLLLCGFIDYDNDVLARSPIPPTSHP
jgi:hypothetical protein